MTYAFFVLWFAFTLSCLLMVTAVAWLLSQPLAFIAGVVVTVSATLAAFVQGAAEQ